MNREDKDFMVLTAETRRRRENTEIDPMDCKYYTTRGLCSGSVFFVGNPLRLRVSAANLIFAII